MTIIETGIVHVFLLVNGGMQENLFTSKEYLIKHL